MKELLEGKKIDSEYEKEWNEIEREIFDQIISLDPQTNIEQDRIGPCSKQLLLPQYTAGEVEFLNDAENVKAALQQYISNRGQFPPALRNITVFPSVKDFVDYVLNGEKSNFAKTHDLDNLGAKKEKEDKIDAIYNKYYNNIDRQIFNKIIALDPETNDHAIGTAAKMLLLPRYIAGEDFLDLGKEVTKAIKFFDSEKSTYPEEKQVLQKWPSVAEFVSYCVQGPETEFTTQLKSKVDRNPSVKIKFLPGTREYDIYEPLSYEGNNAISRGEYVLKWCTGYSRSQWDAHYRNEYIYCFIYKSDNTNRKINYQLAIERDDFTVHQFLDGNDEAYGSFNAGKAKSTEFFKDFLFKNPDVALVCSRIDNLKNCPTVQEVVGSLKYADEAFTYTGADSYFEFKRFNLKKLVQEVIIEAEEILPTTFSGCSSLTKVTFKEGLKKIGAQAFFRCISLNNVQLPSTLEEIDSEAFAYCNSLKNTIRIPDSVNRIGRRAFEATNCTLSINKARTNKLNISPEDLPWFKSHAKAITVQEELLEDIIDENIPRDLANAYKRAYSTGNSNIHNSAPRHAEIAPTNNTRRAVWYDYKNSNYEELSKQEALDYLGLVGQLNGDETKARVIDRNLFNPRIGNLRFLIDGNVAEFDVQDGSNVLKPIYSCTIDSSKFGQYPKFNKGSDRNTGSITKYSDLYTLIQICDKIYKTDEYQHKITPETPTGKKVKIARRDNNGNIVKDENGNIIYDIIDDTIEKRRARNIAGSRKQYLKKYYGVGSTEHTPHKPGDNFNAPVDVYDVQSFDTGDHQKRYLSNTINVIYNAALNKQKLFKIYDYYRKALIKLQNEHDLYDEEEYNYYLELYTQKKNEAYENYVNAAKDYREKKRDCITAFNYYVKEWNDGIKAELDKWQQFTDKIYAKRQALSALSLTSIEEDPKFKKLEDRRKALEEEVNAIKRKKEDILKQIAKLQEQLTKEDTNMEEIEKSVSNLQDDLKSVSAAAMQEKISQLAALQAEVDELMHEYEEKTGKQLTKQRKELDPNLVGILSTNSQEEESETDTVQYNFVVRDSEEKELISFPTLQEAINWAKRHYEDRDAWDIVDTTKDPNDDEYLVWDQNVEDEEEEEDEEL